MIRMIQSDTIQTSSKLKSELALSLAFEYQLLHSQNFLESSTARQSGASHFCGVIPFLFVDFVQNLGYLQGL